jgi:hypothetical protein
LTYWDAFKATCGGVAAFLGIKYLHRKIEPTGPFLGGYGASTFQSQIEGAMENAWERKLMNREARILKATADNKLAAGEITQAQYDMLMLQVAEMERQGSV